MNDLKTQPETHGIAWLLLELALIAIVLVCLKTPLTNVANKVDSLLQPDGLQTALSGLLRGHAK